MTYRPWPCLDVEATRASFPLDLFLEVNLTDGKEGIMASLEKSKDDQKSLSPGLTRRQFLPLLGATAVATATPSVLGAAPGGVPGPPSAASARFVYVGTYTAPGVPPGGTHPSTAVGIYVDRKSVV